MTLVTVIKQQDIHWT